VFDLEMIKSVYSTLATQVNAARKEVGRPLTLSEKILYAHLGGAPALNGYSYYYKDG